MIIDALGNAPLYTALQPGFAAAIRFMQRADLRELPVGKHEIDAEQIYALVIHDRGRQKEEALMEAHRNFVDIQMVLDGIEGMGWKTVSACSAPTGEYDPQNDARLFKDPPDTFFTLHSNQFAIFLPEDAHMPMITAEMIHKVVIKVAITEAFGD